MSKQLEAGRNAQLKEEQRCREQVAGQGCKCGLDSDGDRGWSSGSASLEPRVW